MTAPAESTAKSTLSSQTENLAHARYVCNRGAKAHRRWACKAVGWLTRERNETLAVLNPRPVSVPEIIRQVFGSAGEKAVSVAACESGFSVNAQNGQYLGIFQMGDYARGRYGHGYDAWTQSRAAYAYYRDSGWAPWACA